MSAFGPTYAQLRYPMVAMSDSGFADNQPFSTGPIVMKPHTELTKACFEAATGVGIESRESSRFWNPGLTYSRPTECSVALCVKMDATDHQPNIFFANLEERVSRAEQIMRRRPTQYLEVDRVLNNNGSDINARAYKFEGLTREKIPESIWKLHAVLGQIGLQAVVENEGRYQIVMPAQRVIAEAMAISQKRIMGIRFRGVENRPPAMLSYLWAKLGDFPVRILDHGGVYNAENRDLLVNDMAQSLQSSLAMPEWCLVAGAMFYVTCLFGLQFGFPQWAADQNSVIRVFRRLFGDLDHGVLPTEKLMYGDYGPKKGKEVEADEILMQLDRALQIRGPVSGDEVQALTSSRLSEIVKNTLAIISQNSPDQAKKIATAYLQSLGKEGDPVMSSLLEIEKQTAISQGLQPKYEPEFIAFVQSLGLEE